MTEKERDNLLMGEGEGVGEEQIIWRLESLGLYKLFNTLWWSPKDSFIPSFFFYIYLCMEKKNFEDYNSVMCSERDCIKDENLFAGL